MHFGRLRTASRLASNGLSAATTAARRYPWSAMDLREHFGDIDIYLFDQILKGRLAAGMSLLDAGCGGGRNLVWFLRNGYEVCAVDESAGAVEQVRRLAAALAPHLPAAGFQTADLADLPFPAERFDAVLCSAVLHFARDEAHFDRMLDEQWRVLRPGGLFFARLATTIGMAGRVEPLGGPLGSHWYGLPDGTRRFLAGEEMLRSTAGRLGGAWLEPLKTTLVEDLRAMTTWVLRKPR